MDGLALIKVWIRASQGQGQETVLIGGLALSRSALAGSGLGLVQAWVGVGSEEVGVNSKLIQA